MTETQILPGIWEWTGEDGSGKTSAALGCGAKPERIWFCDADVKGKATARLLKDAGTPFGKFVDVVKLMRESSRMELIWPILKKEFSEIKPGQFDAVVLDSEPEIYQIIRAYVRQNPNEFDDPKEWKKAAGSGYTFFEGKISRTARNIEKQILSELSDKVTAVHITSHIKDDYDANVVVGQVAETSKAIHSVAVARIWLRHNPHHTTPIMLFIKPYGETRWSAGNNRLEVVNIMPRKATPIIGETSVWDTIKRYRKNPANDREPIAGEIPDEHERYILTCVLSDDQKKAWFARLDAEKEKQRQDQLSELAEMSRAKAFAKSLFSEGKAPPAILAEIQTKIEANQFLLKPETITIPVIANWIVE